MRTGLTADKRQDKNGRLVTRWVKTPLTGTPSRAALPSPTASPQRIPSLQVCEEAVRAAHRDRARWGQRAIITEDEAVRGVARLGEPVIRAYAAAIAGEPDNDWGPVLLSAVNGCRTPSDAGLIFAIVRAEDEIDTEWDGTATGCWVFKHADKVRRGFDELRHQGVPVPENGVDEAGNHHKGITELARLTIHAELQEDTAPLLVEEDGPDGAMIRVRDPHVAALVLARPEDRDAISALYLRGGIHGAGIESLIGDEISPPLWEGAL